jgi:hypothetical protein
MKQCKIWKYDLRGALENKPNCINNSKTQEFLFLAFVHPVTVDINSVGGKHSRRQAAAMTSVAINFTTRAGFFWVLLRGIQLTFFQLFKQLLFLNNYCCYNNRKVRATKPSGVRERHTCIGLILSKKNYMINTIFKVIPHLSTGSVGDVWVDYYVAESFSFRVFLPVLRYTNSCCTFCTTKKSKGAKLDKESLKG